MDKLSNTDIMIITKALMLLEKQTTDTEVAKKAAKLCCDFNVIIDRRTIENETEP